MRDRLGGILYVGKAKNLKKRVSTYFQSSRKFQYQQPKIAAMVKLVHDLETIELKSEAEAILLEGRLIKEWKPKYNTDFTDDKRFLLVRVDVQNALPCFRLVRNRRDDGSRYYGPFAQSRSVRKTLDQLRQQFGVLLGDARPKEIVPGQYRLYDDMRAEIYGHPNEVSLEEYRMRVEEGCRFLDGKARDLLAKFEEKMKLAADDKRYEEAAASRDILKALRDTISRDRRFTGALHDPKEAAEHSMEALREALGLEQLPRRIECFDISHISGSYVVASMVCFVDGRPEKQEYRRYRIKTFIGNDDFRAMEEVVGRRYRRLHKEKRKLPYLVMVDGGVGQVNAALKAFIKHQLEIPYLIGLAKKKETIVFAGGRRPLNLSHRHEGLRLLQRVRDEAHRFANAYSADLRSKRIKESILDELSGLGDKRKNLLINHFGSIQKIRRANAKDLQEVDGIGPKLSAEIILFLKRHSRKQAGSEKETE